MSTSSPTARSRNEFGITALVLGIIGFALGWLIPLVWLSWVLAIVFGALGLRRVRRGEATNRAMTLWGMWLGIVGTALALIFIVLSVIILAATNAPSS